MKPFYVKDLKPDEGGRLEDRYLVRNADIRDGNNGKRHLYMTLADATGEVQAVKWSLTGDELYAVRAADMEQRLEDEGAAQPGAEQPPADQAGRGNNRHVVLNAAAGAPVNDNHTGPGVRLTADYAGRYGVKLMG